MSQDTNIGDLFQTAYDDGTISAAALQTLTVVDIGTQIQNALGVDVDKVMASEVVLIQQLLDDSSSIEMAGNAQIIRDGDTEVIVALRNSKQDDSILFGRQTLNGSLATPFQPLGQVILLDNRNYNPGGGTPLYEQAVPVLGSVIAKTQQFADNGVPARSITVIVTDGGDNGYGRFGADDVRTLVEDMLRTEQHIVIGIGIDDGYTDFRQVFRDMGIPDRFILIPGNTPSQIRQAFQVVSQSAVRASQSAANFSNVAGGGFGN